MEAEAARSCTRCCLMDVMSYQQRQPLHRCPRTNSHRLLVASSKKFQGGEGTRKNKEVYETVLGSGFAAAMKIKAPQPDEFRSDFSAEEKNIPEVLAPAGGWPQLLAAVAAGADAVYLGIHEFNARARAENFDIADLPLVMNTVHAHGVKGFVTLNVLLFDSEITKMEEVVRQLAKSRVDAVIVQDLGLAKLVKRIAPSLRLHASTQMSITSRGGADFAKRAVGVDRVVLGRELSIEEIRAIAYGVEPSKPSLANPQASNEPVAALDTNPSVDYETAYPSSSTNVEYEVFVHGALCVSYSGQCFSSEAWGGRSANRGQCAQACRLPYGLIVNGKLQDLKNDVRYLLSPQDLCALPILPSLVDSGSVSCLKIEGRLKGPDYVAITTSAYRQAMDSILTEFDASKTRFIRCNDSLSLPSLSDPDEALPDLDSALRQTFSRAQDSAHNGATVGFFEGVKHQELVIGKSPRHRGILIGTIEMLSKAGAEGEREKAREPKRDISFPASHKSRGRQKKYLHKGHLNMEFPQLSCSSTRLEHLYLLHLVPRNLPLADGKHNDGLLGLRMRLEDSTVRLRVGDGVVIENIKSENDEIGGVISSILNRNSDSLMFTIRGVTETMRSKIKSGQRIWRTRSQDLDSLYRRFFKRSAVYCDPHMPSSIKQVGNEAFVSIPTLSRHLALKAQISGEAGQPFQVRLIDSDKYEGVGCSDVELENAKNSALNAGSVSEAVSAMGGTQYRLEKHDIDVSKYAEDVFIPISQVKLARRRAVENLIENRLRSSHSQHSDTLSRGSVLNDILNELELNGSAISEYPGESIKGPLLRPLCRTMEQAVAMAEVSWVDEVVLDFLEAQGLKEAISVIKKKGKRVCLALPRITKPGEGPVVEYFQKLSPDAFLVRNTAQLEQLARRSPACCGDGLYYPRLDGDFSLNIANAITAAILLQQGGLSSITPTHDLSAEQISSMAKSLGLMRAQRLEVILHHHLPIFHTEYCAYARFLSKGNSFVDCGYPCTRLNLQMRDQNGDDHSVLADMGCRNTVFNASAQSGAQYLSQWQSSGIQRYRIELLQQDGNSAFELVQSYYNLLQNKVAPSMVIKMAAQIKDIYGRQYKPQPGSYAAAAEIPWTEMKRTAASERGRH